MKRYWLFEAPQYYPSGGMLDWIGDYDSIEEAEEARSAKFIQPDISLKEIESMWIKEQEKGIPPELFNEVRSKYQKMSSDVSKELHKMDTGYHILDIQEGKIVKGWDQYGKEDIENIPVKEFK